MVQTDLCVENNCLIWSSFIDHNRLSKSIDVTKSMLLILVNVYLRWKIYFACFYTQSLSRVKKGKKIKHIKLRVCITETLIF